MSHTKGPYVATPSDNVAGAFIIEPVRSLGELPLAIVPLNRRTKDVVAANAQLFATAPLMLEALKALQQHLTGDLALIAEQAIYAATRKI